MKRLFVILTAMLFSLNAYAGFEDTHEIVQTAKVHFVTDKSYLDGAAKVALSKLNVSLPNTEVIIIGGTDSRGSLEYNVVLGLARANSVSEFLKVPASVSSVGEDQAIETVVANMRADRIATIKVITTVVIENPLFGAASPIMGPAHNVQYNTLPLPLGQGVNRTLQQPRL